MRAYKLVKSEAEEFNGSAKDLSCLRLRSRSDVSFGLTNRQKAELAKLSLDSRKNPDVGKEQNWLAGKVSLCSCSRSNHNVVRSEPSQEMITL